MEDKPNTIEICFKTCLNSKYKSCLLKPNIQVYSIPKLRYKLI